jgi:hypothetical protein
VFRKTKPNLKAILKISKPSAQEEGQKEWVENEAKNILRRFKLKVQEQIDTFNITKNCSKVKENINHSKNNAYILEEQKSKFIRLQGRQT